MSNPAPASPADRPAAISELEGMAVARTPILVLTSLAVLLGWLPRMRWGFWIDETATYWMSAAGWRGAIDRTWNWAGQSILYSILESFFFTHGPWQEVILRIPSLVAAGIAAWQLKRLAELLISKEAGWYAVVPFVCAPDVMSFATNARPYALALAASLCSFRYLLEWQRDGGKKNAVLCVLASVLTVYFHYAFGFMFVIEAAYLLCSRWCGTRVRWSLPAAVCAAVPLSILPIAGSLRNAQRQMVDFQAARPEVKQWFQLVFPPTLLLALALGAALVLLIVPMRQLKWSSVPIQRPVAWLLAMWMLVAPTLFFLVSRFTPNTVFTSRYLLFTLPAFVLIIAWAVSGIANARARVIVMLAIFAANVTHPGMLVSAFRESPASWKEPLAVLARKPAGAPVFLASGFAHAVYGNWKSADPKQSPLFAPLTAYPIANPVIPLPYQFFPDVQRFAEEKAADLIAHPLIYLLAESDSGLAPWMIEYMRSQGYQTRTENVNDFVIVEFLRRRADLVGSPRSTARLRSPATTLENCEFHRTRSLN
jgi:mannosyltransferase